LDLSIVQFESDTKNDTLKSSESAFGSTFEKMNNVLEFDNGPPTPSMARISLRKGT
jgi:hypothetical protein